MYACKNPIISRRLATIFPYCSFSFDISAAHAHTYARVCEVKGACPALLNSNKSVSDK